MSLNMSSSISYAAVGAYTQVSRLPVDVTDVTPAASPAINDANNNQDGVTVSVVEQTSTPVQVSQNNPTTLTGVQIVQQAADVVNIAVDTESFENPFNQIRKLFAKIADMFAFENSFITTGQKDFVKVLFNDVVDGLENNAEADDDIDEQVLEVA